MNKLSIFLLGAIALGFTACDDAPGIAPVQTNPQPPMYEDSQISCALDGAFASGDAASVIDLDQYKTANDGVPVVKFTTTDAFPVGAYPSGVLQISKSDEFVTYKEVDVNVVDGVGYVNVYDWNTVQVELFGRARKEREIYYRMVGYVHQDGGVYHIGTPDTYLVSGNAKVLCLDEGIAISSAYYFLGGCTSWKLNTADAGQYKMYHSSADPMDDPIFRFYFNISEEQGENWWKIAPAEAMDGDSEDWSAVYGPEENGNTNPTGLLVEGGEAGKIVGAGTYCIEFNAISMEYNIFKTTEVPYLFTPGTANGWNMYNSQWLAWNADKKAYFGTVKVDVGDGVKFVDIVRTGTGGPSWDNPNYGEASAGVLLKGSPDNVKPAKTGLYWAKIDIVGLTYQLTEVTSVGLIGVGGDWNNDILLTPSDDLLKWTAEVDLSGDWKIRLNGSWDYNYGNTPDDLIYDAGNIGGYDGHYTVTMDFSGNLPRLIISQ